MGVSVYLQADDLRCRSEADAHQAAEIINSSALSPYHLQVVAARSIDGDQWRLEVEHFQGDHWHEDPAETVWLAIAPLLASGSTLQFESEDGVPWRIRWQDGKAFEDYVKEVIWSDGHELRDPQ